MKQLVLFDKSGRIPYRHKKNTRYVKYCVDCGIKVMEWERNFDGIETHRGKLIFSESTLCFGGYRCKKCSEKLANFIAIEYYGKDKGEK